MAIVTEINEDEGGLHFPPPDVDTTKMESSESGFFGSLAQSVFEPGVNKSLFQAMNASFLALVITLLVMAYFTNYNYHVVFLMVVSTGLWVVMIWFVAEISKIQTQPQNAPTASASASSIPPPSASESDGSDLRPMPNTQPTVTTEAEEPAGSRFAADGTAAGRSSAREEVQEDGAVRKRV